MPAIHAAPPQNVLIYVLQLLATIVCACSGALVAGRKNLDLIGLLAISFATGVGGGTVRDVLLDRNPVFWIGDPTYVSMSLLAAGAIWLHTRFLEPPDRFLLILDAFGLGLFLIVGIQIAEGVGQSAGISLIMGVITGVAGGVIRDVLCGDIPLIFRSSELYASAALAGGALYITLRYFRLPPDLCAISGALGVIFLRLAALRWGWRLPVLTLKKQERP